MTTEETKTVMWKPDTLADAESKLEVSKVLHREAGKRGFFCTPKRSHIQRGSYYAEVSQHTWEGRPEFSGLIRPNIALGTGRTPLVAAMNGYQLAGLDDVHMQSIYLEIETHFLRQTARTIGKLERALDDTFAALALAWGYQTRAELAALTAPACSANVPAAYDEDDDL